MSLTKASYSMITGAPANVLDYGADLTGTTDSAPAFTAALAASSLVYIPNGTYRLNSTITLSSEKVIYGAGYDCTIINSYAAASPCFQTTPGVLCDASQMRGFRVTAKSSATAIFDFSTARNCVFDRLQAIMNERTGGAGCTGFKFAKTTLAVANYYNHLSNSYSFDLGATAASSNSLVLGRAGDGANSNYFSNVVLNGSLRGIDMKATVGCVFEKVQIMNCVAEAILMSESSMNFFTVYVENVPAQGTIDGNSINNTFYIYPDGAALPLNIDNSTCYVKTITAQYSPQISLSPATINDTWNYAWIGSATKDYGKLIFKGTNGSAFVSINVAGLTSTAGGGSGTRTYVINYVNSTNPVVTLVTGSNTVTGPLTDITTSVSTSGGYGVVTFTLTANATLQNSYQVSTSITHVTMSGSVGAPFANTKWERL